MEKCTEVCSLAESAESVGNLLKKLSWWNFFLHLILIQIDRSGEEANVCFSQIELFLLRDLAKNTKDSYVQVERLN